MAASDRWAEISALLDAVLDRPPDEQAAYLEANCDDPALRQEVEALLAAEADAPSFLDGAAADLAEDAFASGEAIHGPDLLSPGTELPPYRIEGVLGRGGMSVVYRGSRSDGSFTQDVALKVMRSFAGDASFVQRFLNERQILASITHPNIARVFDGGTTEDGRPYFVMELVEGTPITTYCDEQRASIDERLALFDTVCRAVQHAHQNLIVHRDLKPSNILVTKDGTVKLLDFGIAKLLDEAPAFAPDASLPRTRTGLQLMTPEYAAPEQVTGEAITTATDVYALGILLYELLTGHRPYRLDERSTYQLIQAICEDAPTRPSTIVTRTSPDPSDDPADARQTSTDQLRRRLSGDLDAIILKTLRKPPADRYPTVDALTEDLDRHRSDAPVHARAGSTAYRVQKFARRYWASLSTAAVILLLLVTYAVTVTWQAEQIAQERDKAEAVTSFLTRLFEQTDPLRQGNPNLKVRTVLDRGAERIDTQLDGQPAVRSDLQTVMGNVYTSLGLYPPADALLQSALAARHRTEARPEALAATEQALAYSAFRQGRYARADSLYRETLAHYRAAYGATDVRLNDARNGLLMTLNETGRHKEAEAIGRTSLATYKAADAPVPATLLHNFASTLQNMGKFEESLALRKRALRRYREQYGSRHPAIANVLVRLAFTYHRMDSLAVAESLYYDALNMRRKLLPAGHPHIASSLVRLSWLLAEQGRTQEAAPLIREGLSILRTLLPADHWQIAAAESVQALVWARQGKVAEALPVMQRSFTVFKQQFGLDNWRTQSAARALMGMYQAAGRPQAAARYQRIVQAAANVPSGS
ncbi:serine/threonine-protein kinase [Salisaeta longa]|uniref:serine/threonine-protein kinase n=1 Tax=Salisaeta longa TaxID=503170 RepID=UPI0003B7A4D3|nr:serine/threonine-protein kinase [Salisaeta longa]